MKSKINASDIILDRIIEALVTCDELGCLQNSLTENTDKEILSRARKNSKIVIIDTMDNAGITEQDLIKHVSSFVKKTPKRRKTASGTAPTLPETNLANELCKQVLFQIDCLHNEDNENDGPVALYG